MKMTFNKLVRRALAGGALMLAATGVALSFARVEQTEDGVHQQLLIPIGPAGTVAIRLYANTGIVRSLRERQEILISRQFKLSSARDWSIIGDLISRSNR